mgnify:CR=1 FL=1
MTLLRGHWQLIAIVAAVFALWTTPVLIPLKILIVFLHELSHAVTAVATGGDIISISVSPHQGGEAWTRGGSRFLTLSAGYLGSLLIGVGILWIALKTHLDRWLVAVLGLAPRFEILFYLISMAAFIWSLVVTWKLWQKTRS